MYIFGFHDLIYIAGFLFGVFHFHASTRQKMMLLKFFACILCSYYFYCIGAQSAVYAGLVAALGGLFQACFSEDVLERTKMHRIAIAVFLALGALIVSGGTSARSLPLVAVIISRLSEAQSKQQHIRFGYLLSQLCWVFFAYSQGIMLVFFTENINLMSNLAAIWRGEQLRKKLVTVPARFSRAS